jgi:hypothetical protein
MQPGENPDVHSRFETIKCFDVSWPYFQTGVWCAFVGLTGRRRSCSEMGVNAADVGKVHRCSTMGFPSMETWPQPEKQKSHAKTRRRKGSEELAKGRPSKAKRQALKLDCSIRPGGSRVKKPGIEDYLGRAFSAKPLFFCSEGYLWSWLRVCTRWWRAFLRLNLCVFA